MTDTPRRLVRNYTPTDLGILGGSLVSGLLLAWLVYYRLTPAHGWFGFLLAWYGAFLALYYAVCREAQGRIAARDRVATVVVASGALLMFIPLLWLVVFVVAKGLPTLRLDFFTHDQRGVRATDPATTGGALHSIVGTLEQVGIAVLLSVPLGVLTAVYLTETRSKGRRGVRTVVDAMSGLPSEVAGLFIFAALVLPISRSTHEKGYSGIMASLALMLIMVPTVTRTVEVVLRLVPNGLREASFALGAARWRTVWSVVLPTARSGLATAVVLGIARTVGETAPLIFTSFGYDLMNANPFHGPQDSLPLFVFARIQSQSNTLRDRAYTGGLVLLLLVLFLFVIARLAGRRRKT